MKRIIPNIWAYILIVLTVILLALLFLFLVWPLGWQTTEFVNLSDEVQLDGYKPTTYLSVMLDNSIDAMPQAGLAKAVVVYEALIEGGFTRLMAIFDQSDLPKVIGPVRSARPYFLDWANDWAGSYWYAGGSPQALQNLEEMDWSFVSIDEISYQGIYFWRDYSFFNPHNLFTRPELIERAVSKYEIVDEINYFWDVKDELELEYRTDDENIIHVPYPQADNDVYWHYDKSTNSWQRYIGEVQQLYFDGSFVSVKNVIVLVVDARLVDIERLGMDTIGQGKGYLFRDGQGREIIWQKQSADSQLEFLSGQRAVQLNFGKTWIQILPSYLNFEYN